MERIQAAIAKARQAREAAGELPATPTPRHTAARPAGAPDATPDGAADSDAVRDALWQALPEYMPKPAVLRRNRIVAFETSPEATPFDIARTRVLRMTKERNWKRLAVTSPNADCGKSTLVMNLAFSLARQKDVRAVVLELDMRRPTIGRVLGTKSTRSVADLLTEEASFADCAMRVNTNLAMVTQPTQRRNASDILLGARIGQVLDEIEARYAPDLMIFDTPPLLYNDDTIAFLKHTDCALLVAAAGRTTIKEIDACEKEIAAQTNVLGITLNKVRYLPSGYSAKDYYS